MFTLYCDDSGTNAESDIAVAGCYVSTTDQWEFFKRDWRYIDDKENFGVFHMADFVARRKQFANPEWKDDPKRERTIKALISTIKTRARIGFSAAVVKSAYDKLITGDLRKRLAENHYTFAVRLCTALVDKWRQQYGITEPVQYVFDRMAKGRGDIDSMFGILVSGKQEALDRYGVYKDCWSFQDKSEVIQLQAADIWAYENYRYMKDCFIPYKTDGEIRSYRASYRELTNSPCIVRYYIEPTLEALVQKLKARGTGVLAE